MLKSKLILSMLIFSTIGIFVKSIALPSATLALTRGCLGAVFLLILARVAGRKLSAAAIRRNLWILAASGAAIGINWMLLFEAYRHTTVAIATLSYYLAPVFVMLLAPLVLKERLTARKIVCIILALVGMVLVSGVVPGGWEGASLKGILFGAGAAIFYAGVILLNQGLTDISPYESTIVQLGVAAAVLSPHVFLSETVWPAALTGRGLALVLTVGIVHTGIGYWLYFSSMAGLSGQTVAIFSYIDPAAAVLLSVVLLRESLDVWGILGAALILGATLWSEIRPEKTYTSG